MIELTRLRNQLAETRRVSLVDLKDVLFYGAFSYILNPASLGKVHAAVGETPTLDLPFDDRLRDLISAGRLRAFVFVPFLTSLAETNLRSQIRQLGPGSANLVWHAFSRFLWADGRAQQRAEMREAMAPHWSVERAPMIEAFFKEIDAGKLAEG
jgi:hypothetical protein